MTKKITIDFNEYTKSVFSYVLQDPFNGGFGLTLDEFIDMCKYEYMRTLDYDYEDGEIEAKENSGELSFVYDRKEFNKIYTETYDMMKEQI